MSIPALNASSRKEASAIFSSFTGKVLQNLGQFYIQQGTLAGNDWWILLWVCRWLLSQLHCIIIPSCLGWPTVNSARASLSVRLYVSSAASKDLNLPLRYVHTRPLTLLSVKSKHLKIHYLSICTTQQLKMCIISITKKWNCLGIFFTFIFSWFNIGEDSATQ